MALLLREVSNIYVPPVDCVPDDLAFEQMFEQHVAQKQLMQELLLGDANPDEMLEALEIWIGTRGMDAYIERTDREIDRLIGA